MIKKTNKKGVYPVVMNSLRTNREKTLEVIYANLTNEGVAMTNFINSRQEWCKEKILKELKEI